MSLDPRFPKLRPLDIRPIVHDGRQCLLLRDPMQLSGNSLVIAQIMAPLLMLCDGTRDRAELRMTSALRYGLPVDDGMLDHVLETLDQALLLENERFTQARSQALAAYRQAPFRPLLLADQSYPADANELSNMFDRYLDQAAHIQPHSTMPRGILSPHIDYLRGGAVYAAVWKRAAQAAQQADLVVLFGTDHYGDSGRLTLTRQHYATPFGILPTDTHVVDALAQAIGLEHAFAHELRHRGEHAIELVANWLHYIRDGRPCDMVPILCGSFSDFVHGRSQPGSDGELNALLAALEQATAGRRVLVVASGDLAHVGPAFGGRPLDRRGREHMRAADQELITWMIKGDAAGFFGAVRHVRDQNNVCGLPPLYLALRLLGASHGERVAYDQCPADDYDTSLVSISGIVFL